MFFKSITFAALVCIASAFQAVRADLCDDLLLHYSFDRVESNVVEDLSGNEHHGTAFQSSSVPGISGNALSFNSVGWVDAGNIFDITPERPVITVIVWVKGQPTPFDNFIIGKQQDFFPNRGWALRLGLGTRADLVAINNVDEAKAADPSDLRDGTWHCMAVVFESAADLLRSSLYVDGVLKNTAQKIGPHAPLNTVARLWIGKQFPGGTNGFRGEVDEVRVYGSALSSDEIMWLARYPGLDPCPDEPKHWLSRIGFSNDPEGDQDVTEFYIEETLFVTIDDVQFNGREIKKSKLELKQHASGKKGDDVKERYSFEMGEDGLWRASAPLAVFGPGDIEVKIELDAGGKQKIKRESLIRLHE